MATFVRRKLFSSLFLTGMTGSSQSVINGSSFTVPTGLSPMVFSDRGDAEVGKPGTWRNGPGYGDIDPSLYEQWVLRLPETSPDPICLDVEVENYWRVAHMLSVGKLHRPKRLWGFYVGPLGTRGVRTGNQAYLFQDRGLPRALEVAAGIADFVAPCVYAWPGAELNGGVIYRNWLDYCVSLFRYFGHVVPCISPWCHPQSQGAAGSRDADTPCAIVSLGEQLTLCSLFGGEGIIWGGRNHTLNINRPWNPDSHGWWWKIEKWLAEATPVSAPATPVTE